MQPCHMLQQKDRGSFEGFGTELNELDAVRSVIDFHGIPPLAPEPLLSVASAVAIECHLTACLCLKGRSTQDGAMPRSLQPIQLVWKVL